MIEVYSSRDSVVVGHLQGLLESEGIKTFYRNEFVASMTVEAPVFAPVLCVLNEGDAERAAEVIRGYLEEATAVSGEDWTCAGCGEVNPGTFAECWSCGKALDGGEA